MAMISLKRNLQSPYLLAICLIAVFLRVIWALLVPVIPISDGVAYDTFAQNIWLHGTYGWTADNPTSFWPVGTSAIYSLFYMVFGHSYLPIIVFNILCSLAIIIFTRLLCDHFFENKKVGLYASLAVAIWPTLIVYTTILASELPYMAFLMAAFYFFIQRESSIVKAGIISGCLFSIAYYIRPLAVIVLAIGIFYLFVNLQNKKITILRSLTVMVLLVILVSPWAYRNFQTHNAFIPMSTNGGATLWMGNQPDTNGGYVPTPKHLAHLNEHVRNQLLKQEAIDYIKQEPVSFLIRTAEKFLSFHLRETIGVGWNEKGIRQVFGDIAILPLKVICQLYWSLVLAAACMGVFLFFRRHGFWRTAFHPFILIWMSAAAIHAIIVSQDRYHIPVIPFIVSFAAYFICCAELKFKRVRKEKISNE
jgi:hypothetical protein